MSVEFSLVLIVVLLAVIAFLIVLMLVRAASWEKALLEVVTDAKEQRPHQDLQKLLNNRSYEMLFQTTKESLESRPDDPALLWYHGLAAFHLSKFDLALDLMKRAIRIEPGYGESLDPYIKQLEGNGSNAA